MDRLHFETLTPRQLDCLRLVARDLGSKEIGEKLGISYETVNSHIAGALRTLGINDRFRAARLLADHEGRHHPMVSQPLAMVKTADDDSFVIPPHHAATERSSLREQRIPYVGARSLDRAAGSEREQADVSRLARIGLIALIVFVVMLAIIAAGPLANSFEHLGHQLQ